MSLYLNVLICKMDILLLPVRVVVRIKGDTIIDKRPRTGF